MLLYVHVPFCRRKCRYCAFVSEPLGADGGERMQSYVATLLEELHFWHERLQRESCPPGIETIFWGGGTPSLLEPEQVRQVLDEVHALFDVADDAEISMEANPDSLHAQERVRAFLAAGINRISLGVQTLDDGQLKALGRVHCAEEARQAVQAIREAGCTNLNIDLMWGLPGQTPEQWRSMLKAALDLSPEHVSAYGLMLEPGTPMAEQPGILPSEDQLASMFTDCVGILGKNGLEQYEISNFARAGYRCRHNLGYWEGKDYLGLGPAATSTIRQLRWTNPSTLESWMEQVRLQEISPDREHLDAVIVTLETMMLRLRTVEGLPLNLYAEWTGRNFLEDHGPFVEELLRHDLARLVEKEGESRLSLTVRGMLLSNSILETLFEETHHLLDC